jgi:hypothetical protein
LGSSLLPAKLARQDSGVFEEMKCLFSFTPKVERSGEVTRVTDAGQGSDRRWRRICQLTLEDELRRSGVRHAGVRATHADVGVSRSCAAEAAMVLVATYAEPRLSLVRQARLSTAREKGALCATSIGATDVRPRRVGRV